MSLKSLAVAQGIIDAGNSPSKNFFSFSPMKLLKLSYIAHGYMLGRHGRPLLGEQVMAYMYGPIVPSIYNAVRHFGSSRVYRVPGAPDDYKLHPDEMAVIADVVNIYGRFNAITLSSAMHHVGTPWSAAWGVREESASMSNDLIRHFYTQLLTAKSHSTL